MGQSHDIDTIGELRGMVVHCPDAGPELVWVDKTIELYRADRIDVSFVYFSLGEATGYNQRRHERKLTAYETVKDMAAEIFDRVIRSTRWRFEFIEGKIAAMKVFVARIEDESEKTLAGQLVQTIEATFDPARQTSGTA